VCGLCNRVIHFVARHDRDDHIRITALDGTIGAAVASRHPTIAGIDSIVCVERYGQPNESVSTRSDAVLRIASRLPWPARAWGLARVVPRPLRDAVYDLIARNRYRVFGRLESCPVPTPELRRKLMDLDESSSSPAQHALASEELAP
jgi:predicted DCC family thiol-disulfide oxidoreductase YuxK